jgi:hypothetical protein
VKIHLWVVLTFIVSSVYPQVVIRDSVEISGEKKSLSFEQSALIVSHPSRQLTKASVSSKTLEMTFDDLQCGSYTWYF